MQSIKSFKSKREILPLLLTLAALAIFSLFGGGCTAPFTSHHPIINSTPNTIAFINEPYIYNVDATDPDVGDILTYFLISSPEGMTIDSATGEINWTPTDDQIEENDVTVEVSDNGFPIRSDTQSFKIEVYYAGNISGIVISDATGPAVKGSTVTVDGTAVSTTTDADGNYVIDKAPVGIHDIIVTQPGRAASKMQSINIIKDKTTTIEFIQKEANVPTWEINPPTISTSGIAEGDTLSGTVTCSAQVADASDIKCIYVGLDYIPYQFENEFEIEDSNEIVLGPIDTTTIPDGEFRIVIVAYDMNYNRSQLTLNITINNGGSGAVPATPTSLWPLSVTLGENMGWRNIGGNELLSRMSTKENLNIINLLEGRKIDLNEVMKVADPDSNLYVSIKWDKVENASGYRVYRKFESESSYQYIGFTGEPLFDDIGPQLSVGKKTYYQVSAFNSFGESEKTAAEWTTPLPKFNINLISPQNNATGVSVTPTLQWQPVEVVGKYQFYDGYIMGKNDGYYLEETIENKTFMTYNGTPLQYLKVYEWNVSMAKAYDDFYSTFPTYRAVSYAGAVTGSLNGAFEFTTKSE